MRALKVIFKNLFQLAMFSVKTILKSFLVPAMICILLPNLLMAQFSGGSGTKEDPFRIETLEQLQRIAESVHRDKNFVLISNIDATETAEWNEGRGFVPIGNAIKSFTGTFDGQGYIIEGLTINRKGNQYVGLFGRTDRAVIKNILLENADVTGGSRTGALVGGNYGIISKSAASGLVRGKTPEPIQPDPHTIEEKPEEIFADPFDLLEPPERTGVLESFNPEKGYLGYAISFLETIMEKGADRYGPVHSPMFLSIVDVRTDQHPASGTLPVPSQRQQDRAHMGGNLQFDIPLLKAMEAATRITEDNRYKDAAHDYLDFFLEHCTDTPTGLWPWGEHAYWNFYRHAPGANSATGHEYNDDPDDEFWQLAWQMNQKAVIGQANGLLNHILDLNSFIYDRHGPIFDQRPVPRPDGLSGSAYVRQGGYFIRLWAFVYANTGDARYLDHIENMFDFFEANIDQNRDLVPLVELQSSGNLRTGGISAYQNHELFVSLVRALRFLDETQTGERVEILSNRIKKGLSDEATSSTSGNVGFDQRRYDLSHVPGLLPEHQSAEDNFEGEKALQFAQFYRLTGADDALHAARDIAQIYVDYAEAEQVPWELSDHIRAGVLGMTINLMLDMHELEGSIQWLPAARRYARMAIERFYYNGWFLGATNRWYYDANLRSGLLVYALVRLHALEQQLEIDISPMYFWPSR